MNSSKHSQSMGARALVAAPLAALGLTLSPAAWSLGLGDARVESFLNQPLVARIDLLTQASDDVSSVTARLASAADYELIGASRESVSVPIRFTIEDIDGDAYILATSSLPIGEPIVRLIVEVNWSSGRLLREYTLFLDPPMVPDAAPAPAPRIDARTKAPIPPPATATPAAPSAPPAARPTASAPSAATTTVSAGESEYGPVRSGDTLWRIASNWSQGSGLDVNRVMIAIQRENPDAFLNGNINLLKRGAILRMPERSDIEAVSAAAAYREVAQQEEAFSGIARPTPTVASPSTPLLAEEAAPPEPSRSPEPPADDAAPVESPSAAAADDEAAMDAVPGGEAAEESGAESRDVLELVPPSPDSELDSAYGFEEAEEAGDAGTDVEALRENLARAEEDLINQQQQNAYLEERIRELESQLESAEEDGVADADMANMEARLQAERQAAAQARAARPSEQPWYTRWWAWLLGLAVVVAAVVGWLFSRREPEWEASAEESLRDIKSEAEDVLRVLGEDADEKDPGEAETEESEIAAAERDEDAAGDADDENEDENEDEGPASAGAGAKKRSFGVHEGDAELLDEDSSDPEIQLDLARAYISMGDKEAARVILDEVVNNGSEKQQEEARKMLDLLA